ncbi:MFS transporter [Acinetobacter baumannii]|uniref:MFS transporter n=1 Tax=Acinetobacter baumannii TaxID=470 RepID=UPI00066E6432|nr:MFS transporter [Acinetobacter baumannii]SSW75532.1 H+ Antiporter protein [Klebsiella pneumoniae]KMV05955.1 major Facilitator Superfamily protein [Acinetobacter baumannii]MBD0439582.1 MFS transporter [Acinetobacter baumannii]MBJ9701282.1 MFS transporter [Acinetobacter baumannii]MCD0191125.1 MFS transporter [Acinetobacter baumannii]
MNSSLTVFIFARSISLLIDEMITFAVPVAIYIDTGSLIWSGFSLIALTLLRVVLLPFLASVADRYHLRSQFLCTDGLRTIFAFLIFLAALAHINWLILLLVGFLTLLNGYAFILLEKTAVMLTEAPEMGRIQARLQAVEQLARIMGPAAAGLVLHFGEFRAVAAIAIMMFSVSWGLVFIAFKPKENLTKSDSDERIHQNITFAIKKIMSTPGLVWLVGVSMVSNFVEGIILTLTPMIFISKFARSQEDLGIFFSITAAITIIVLISISMLKTVHIGNRLSLIILSLMATCSLLIPLSNSYIVFAGLYLTFVVLRTVFVIHMRTERARIIPQADFGKVLGVMVCLFALPLPFAGLIVSLTSNIGLEPNILLWGSTVIAIFIAIILRLYLIRKNSEDVDNNSYPLDNSNR